MDRGHCRCLEQYGHNRNLDDNPACIRCVNSGPYHLHLLRGKGDPKITVSPGGAEESVVTCPTGWHAISGGYVIVGFVGLSVPTATEDAIGTSGRDWYVQVADPKTASGDIAFRAEVNCMISGSTTN